MTPAMAILNSGYPAQWRYENRYASGYEQYCHWCWSLGIEPAAEDVYQHEIGRHHLDPK